MSAQAFNYPQTARLQRASMAESASSLRHYLTFALVLGLFVAATLPGRDVPAGSAPASDSAGMPPATGGSLADGHGFTVQAQGVTAGETGLYSHPSAATPLLLLPSGTAVEVAGQLTVASGLSSHRLLWIRVQEGGRTRHGFIAAEGAQLAAGTAVELAPDFLLGSAPDPDPSASGGPAGAGAVMAASVGREGAVAAAASAAEAGSIAWLPPSVGRWWPNIQDAAQRHGVDPELVAIVVTVESGGNPVARSHAGATGLMQLMPATAAEVARRLGRDTFNLNQLTDAKVNLDLGAAYLAQQLAAFGKAGDPDWQQSVELAAAAYNGGPGMVGAVERGERGLPAETRSYVAWVGGMWRERRQAESATYSRWWWAGGQRLVAEADGQLAMLR